MRLDFINLHVFAASKSILIVLQTFGIFAEEFKRVNESSESQISEEHKNSLFAIDLTRAETPRVLWEHSTLVNYSMHINVANFKIYKLETNPDGSTVFSILSPETGQTISTWPSNLFEMDICDITFSSFNRSDSYICERDRKVAEHVRWIPVTVAVARIPDRKRRVIVIDLQDQSIQIIYKDEHIKDVLMCKDFLIIKRDPHPPKFFNLPMRLFFETHNRQLYPLLDQKGICHLLEEKETKQNGPGTPLTEAEWTIRNVKYCDQTPRVIVRKYDRFYHSNPDILADSFVSVVMDHRDRLFLSVIPFPTGCETTKEIRKEIYDFDGYNPDFEYFFSESKALFHLFTLDSLVIILLDFNI